MIRIATPFLAMLAFAAPLSAQTPAAPAPAAPTQAAQPQPAAPAYAAPDYAQDANWLCRPGRADACAANLDATIIDADGGRTIETFKADPNPAYDCFYVYPTVSMDPTPNSDMVAGPEEKAVATAQAARFTRHCRVFAPMYRQITLAALRDILLGKATAINREMAYEDVKAAWDSYLAHDNQGRGVVLIGHSQGSLVLKTLLMREIDGKPISARIISAMLAGANVAVPPGQDVGGDLKAFPLCRSATQTGCLVNYVSFRAEAPPPPGARFGTVPQPGMVNACVNPAAPAGGRAVTDAYLGTYGAGLSSTPQAPWTNDGKPVTTPFVKVPGLISAECAATGDARYLAITVNADPSDPRTDTIGGDIVVGGGILKDWGLHLLDMPVVMGNLVELSNTQAVAWIASHPGK